MILWGATTQLELKYTELHHNCSSRVPFRQQIVHTSKLTTLTSVQTRAAPIKAIFILESFLASSRVSSAPGVVIKIFPLSIGWSVVEWLIIGFSVLESAVALVVDGTFSGEVLFAPLWFVGEGIELRTEEAKTKSRKKL